MRIAYRPAGRWKGVVELADGDGAFKVVLLRLSNCTVQQENLLVYLSREVSTIKNMVTLVVQF